MILGSRDGAAVRALASHQCDPGSIPRLAWCHMWVQFIGSVHCFDQYPPGTHPVFLSPQKPTYDLICVDMISVECPQH